MENYKSLAFWCKAAFDTTVILLVMVLLLVEIPISQETQVFLLVALCITMF